MRTDLQSGPGNLAVAGRNGFIGQAIINRLQEDTHSFNRIIDLARIATPTSAPTADATSQAVQEWVQSNPPEFENLVGMLSGCSTIINAAGRATPDEADEGSLWQPNCVLPLVLAHAAEAAGVSRLVHISSAAVQGYTPTINESASTMPFSAYTRSKAAAESVLRNFASSHDLQVVIYRPTSVLGESRKSTDQLLRLLRSRLIPVLSQERDMPLALVENVADLALYLARIDDPPEIVTHPSEGITNHLMIKLMGRPTSRKLPLPAWAPKALNRATRLLPLSGGAARRAALFLDGQAIESSASSFGYVPSAPITRYTELARTSAKHRLWLVSELFYPEETSTGHVMTTIAVSLVAHDRNVNALCAQPTYSQRGTTCPTVENWNGIHIRRARALRANNTKLTGKLVNLVTITTSMTVNALLRVRKGDTLVAVTNPPSLPYAMMMVAAIRRARLVVLVHDLYPDVLISAGMLTPESLRHRALRRASAVLLSSAELVITVGRDQQALVQQRVSDPCRVKVIRQSADLADVVHHPRRADDFLLHELGLPGSALSADAVVFQFAGNIGPLQNVDGIIEAIKGLACSGQGPNARFLFVGSGRSRSEIQAGIEGGTLPHTFLHDWVPREKAPLLHAACDVSLISLRRGMLGVSVPSRIGNALASGRPVIAVCEAGSELDLLVREHCLGWSVPPGDSAALVAAFADCCANPSLLPQIGARCRAAAELLFSPELMEFEYRQVISSIESHHR